MPMNSRGSTWRSSVESRDLDEVDEVFQQLPIAALGRAALGQAHAAHRQ